MQPARDLLARIPLSEPDIVYDLGCGTGNVTQLISERWPDARVTGVDISPEMLAKARKRSLGIEWVEADAATWRAARPADLIFSNATFQWVEDHSRFFPRLADDLASGGVLAVQIPRHYDGPSHTLMVEAAKSGPWRERLAPLLGPAPVGPPEFYHDLLSPHFSQLEIWETIYLHALEGENPVAEWMKGTALRPMFEPLSDEMRDAFFADFSARIAEAYPPRADGRTLYPFRRLFILAVD